LASNAAKDYMVYVLASVLILVGLFGLYDDVAVSAGSTSERTSNAKLSQLPPPFAGVTRMHIVLIGADEKEGDVGRSDTLMVMWLNPELKRAAIMSIPRDLKADIPDHGSTKINAAFAYGGAPLTTRTVERLVGISVDGYLKVNFQGFCTAVDSLGGVDLLVPDIEGQGRGMNYDDNWGNLHVHLTPGLHHLNGYEAMGFCRYRKSNYANLGDGDGGRAARQQQFIKAVVEQKLKVSNAAGILRAGRQIMSCVETNLTWRQCVDLARLLKEMNQHDIKTVTIPVADGTEGGIWFSHLIDSAFQNMLADINQHLDSDSTAVCDVEVLNGSGTAGMGKAAAAALAKAGFNVTRVDTAPDEDHETTRIRYLSGNQSLAASAAAALGAGKPEAASPAEAAALGQVPLQVVVGGDYERVAQPLDTTPAKEE
jgi:polyisoprenyl-teichoic acid--peptidoglycan teichoic acid transferase